MGNNVYIKPSEIMMADQQLRKLTVGQRISPKALGWAEHPIHGLLPDIQVKEITADGRLQLGEFQCTENGCKEKVAVHPGDWFQKRFCDDHKAKHKGATKKLDPVVKAEREAERTKLREQKKIDKAKERLAKKTEAVEKKLEEAKQQAALTSKVAQDRGVPVTNRKTA